MAWRTSCDWENWRPRGEEASTLTVHSLKRPMVSVHAYTSKMIAFWDAGNRLINELLTNYFNYLLIYHSFFLLRSGQVGVPAGPREPGNLPEGLRPDRALLQHWRRGPVSGSRRRFAAAAVPLPAVRSSDGGLPAIMLNPPSRRAPPSSSPLLISLTLCPLPRSRATTALGSPPPPPFSSSERLI